MEVNFDKTSFLFQGEIYPDDGRYNLWYGDLQFSDFLLEKLQKKVFYPGSGFTLCVSPVPEFYLDYDPSGKIVSLFARFTAEHKKLLFPQFTKISLTSEEVSFLTFLFEESCRQQHNGLDCLTVLNNERKKRNMPCLKQL